ncbi:MAG: hypothetical protein E6G87_01735 [Alphaproteobacteria bacterium]|nr:MAG: hypothetical protein E6G87_01735 [Alphaproteobacteria bacterium]
MNHVAEIKMLVNRIEKTESLVARQVERVFVLRSAHLDCDQAEAKLSELCAALASCRARLTMALAAIKVSRPNERSLRTGSDVAGPRWRIGWAPYVGTHA